MGLSVETHKVILIRYIRVMGFIHINVMKAPTSRQKVTGDFITYSLSLKPVPQSFPFVGLSELCLFLLNRHS